VLEALARFASTCLGYFPTLVLMWLALFFGRTLRPGEMPLIERIARVGKPNPSQRLVRYTRGLTALWCAYFVIAAVLTVGGASGLSGGESWSRVRLRHVVHRRELDSAVDPVPKRAVPGRGAAAARHGQRLASFEMISRSRSVT